MSSPRNIPLPESDDDNDDSPDQSQNTSPVNEIEEETEVQNSSPASETDTLLKDESQSDIPRLPPFGPGYAAFLVDNFTESSCQKLGRFIRECYRRFKRFPALCCFALLLMPGFIQVVCHYFFSWRVVYRSIRYGDHQSNRLDLYLPQNDDGLKPVIAFVTGGAWIIGYKSWGSLLAQQLQEQDIIVACIHYRNNPRSSLSDMVDDVSKGISHVCNRIVANYGGDPNRIYVMGQQIGAYLATCAILHQAIEEAADHENVTWHMSQIRHFLGLSGGNEIFDVANIFKSRGLYDSIKLCVVEGVDSATRFSPELLVVDVNENVIGILPTFSLFHGTEDHSISSVSSESFRENLLSAGANAEINLYNGKNDTDLFLLDPMRGGRDELFDDVIGIIHGQDENALDNYARAPPRPRLVPECMLKLARRINLQL